MKIYTALAPSPSRIIGLVRLLEAHSPNGAARREFYRLMDPTETIADNAEPDDVREVLQAAIELGLAEEFRVRNEPHIRLRRDEPARSSSSSMNDRLQYHLARLVFKSDVSGAPNSFALICVWLLAQPVASVPQGHNELLTALSRSGFTLAELHLSNPSRVDMILYWARYLGLIIRLRLPGGAGAIPDPSAFVRRNLHDLFPDTATVLTAADFRARLGELCPALDGGAARAALLARQRAVGVAPWPDARFSDGLSFALRRLRSANELHWTYVDDSRGFVELTRGERVNFFHRSAELQRRPE